MYTKNRKLLLQAQELEAQAAERPTSGLLEAARDETSLNCWCRSIKNLSVLGCNRLCSGLATFHGSGRHTDKKLSSRTNEPTNVQQNENMELVCTALSKRVLTKVLQTAQN